MVVLELVVVVVPSGAVIVVSVSVVTTTVASGAVEVVSVTVQTVTVPSACVVVVTVNLPCCMVETDDCFTSTGGALGVVVGLFLAYVAVRQGWVSAPGKAKKFVKGGAMESRAVLEARRRTLLAALKELETAHETREVPDDAYGPLKEEYKAQAVRVMRSLEEKKE